MAYLAKSLEPQYDKDKDIPMARDSTLKEYVAISVLRGLIANAGYKLPHEIRVKEALDIADEFMRQIKK